VSELSGSRPEIRNAGLSSAALADAEQLFRSRQADLVTVDQPLVLIGQIQRSGGTLLNSMLDGHPEVHCHPHQLKFKSTKYTWPDLETSSELDADDWLEILREPFIKSMFGGGYSKRTRKDVTHRRLPFTIVPSFMDDLFRQLWDRQRPASTRELLDCFFTSLFNAWMDCQGLRDTPKRWVVGFAPRMGWGESRQAFWRSYPDGRLIMIVRDPRAWYASEAILSMRERSQLVGAWCRNAGEIVAAKSEAPDRVLVLTYESLAREPESTMRSVAAWLGIGWDPILVVPTFNRLPTQPNSSHPVVSTGVVPELADYWRTVLDSDTVAAIERRTQDLHDHLLEITDVPRRSSRS
jgi:hypothetical protein